MVDGILPDEFVDRHEQLRDISIIAGRNVRGLLGIAEWIEESGHPRKAEAVRVMAHQLDEVVGELGTLVEDSGDG
jgi:hypothetical protein